MGLREKVTLALVTIALTQIACRHCMPRTPRKASLKQYLNDLKPVKNQPVPTPYSPSRVNKTPKQTFRKTPQNGRIGKNSLPKKSLYKTYNFPENEYPLDNSPRDPFSIGMNFNQNNNVNTLQKARNLQSSAINDLKKDMKMKRKLLSNKQVNNENRQLKTDISLIKFAPNPESMRLLDSETFPEVQYPLNTMDTWGRNYWNYLAFTQEKPFPGFGQQTFNPKAKEDTKQPFTRLTKATASKYLQSYDKLKEEHRRTSTENSKRSNVGQTGLNFTKTATCERVSDDFITAGLLSNIPSHSTEIKKALTSTKITTSSENTCPVTDNSYHPMPIPYKIIEDSTEYNCPTHEPKNKTKELQDVDNSDIAQTLKLIQEMLLNDDTSSTVLSRNYSEEVEQNNSTSGYTFVSANEDISTTKMDSAKNCTQSPTEELLQEVSDDNSIGNLQNMTSPPDELTLENTATIASPLNVKMSLPFSDPITYEALTNALNAVPTTLSNGNAVPGSTSIIIIPFNNNAVGKSQSHLSGKLPDTPIIVYLPSTQSSKSPSQPAPFNQIVSSSLDNTVPKNQLYNVLSNKAPLQNDSPYSNALVSELLNSYSDSGPSVPMSEMLPTNSMCYNNESSPSSMREKPVLDIIIDKSLTDDALFVTTACDEKLSEQSKETGNLNVNIDTLPPISDFEHPLFDFSDSEFTLLSHGPYNNVLHNELPIIAREIDSDQQILNVTYKDLFIPTQNVTSEHLQKTIDVNSVSKDSLSEIPNDDPPVALDENLSSVTPTDNMEILNTNTLLPESIPNMQEHVDRLTESLPQTIDKILLSTPFLEPPSAEPPQPKEASLLPTLLSERLSDKLPLLPVTPVLETTTEIAPQHTDNPMMTDMTLKTELYKIRQILDKMLSTETPAYTQPPPVDTTLLSVSNSDSLPMNEIPNERLPVPAEYKTLLPLLATDNPIDSSQQLHETLPPMSNSVSEALILPGNKLVTPNNILDTDPPPLPIDEKVTPTLESATSADNKPFLLDNLVTPLSETITTRTKHIPNNGLSHKMEDLPLKMDLKCPDKYEVYRDDLPPSVDDLPTQVRPYTTNDLPIQVVETLASHSEVPVSDLPKPTDVLSLPVDEVLEGISPDVLTDSVKTLMSGSIDKKLQEFPSSKVSSHGLPTPSMNIFKSTIHETFPDGQFNEISSLSDVRTNKPSLEDYSPSLVVDKEKLLYSTADTKDLPLAAKNVLSPETDETPDSLVADISSVFPLSTNLEGIESIKLDKTSDEVLSESPLSELPHDDLPFPEDNMLPLSNNTLNNLSLPINKTHSNSKLRIAKVLLENILSDITKKGLSSLVTKALPATPHLQLDEALHNVNVKSPLPETKEIPLRPVETIFPNSELPDKLIDYVVFSEKPVDISITDLPSELPLTLDEVHKDNPYIPTDDVEDNEKNKTESLSNPTHYLPVPNDKFSPSKSTTKTTSSKLPITKVLLENVLSDITTKGFSVPVGPSHIITSPSVLDKTRYNIESAISQITEDSPSLPEDKILSNTLLSNHPTDNLSISIEDTFPLPIEKTFSELQCLDIPTESTSPIDNLRPNMSMYNKEQAESENLSSEKLTNDLSASPMEGMVSKDTPSELTLPKNKISTSSKLPITMTLLKNVLSDINTRGSSLPVTKALSVTPRSQLDKTLYFMEFPAEKSSVIPNDNFPSFETNEYVFPRPTDKTLPDNPVLDIPTELLLKDSVHNSDIFTDDVEQEHKFDILVDDVSQEEKPDMLTYDVQDDESGISTNDVGQENIFGNLTDDVEQEDKSEVLTDDVEQEHKCDNLTDDVGPNKFDMLTDDEQQEDEYDILAHDVEQKDNSVNLADSVVQEDKSENLTDDVKQEDKFVNLTVDVGQEEKFRNLTNNVKQEDKSDILTDDVEQEDKFRILSDDLVKNKFDMLTDDAQQEDKSGIMTDDVQQKDKFDNLTYEVEQEDNFDMLPDDVQKEDKSGILIDDVEQADKYVHLTDDVGHEDKSNIWTGDVEQEDKSDDLVDDVIQEDKSNILTNDVEQEDKSVNLTDDVVQDDKSVNLTDDVVQEDKSGHLTENVEDEDDDQYIYIVFDDEDDRDNFEDLSYDIEIEDSNESLISEDATVDMPNDNPLSRTKPYLASRIPITKALLVRVLSNIIEGGIHP